MQFSLITLTALVASAFAYTQPKGDSPTGNPIIAPGLNAIVPVGSAYTITWTPTETANNITLLLLRGPSTNCVPIATIVENIENSGSYIWTPSTDLEDDTTHYGIELIVEKTGQYQYSTQFGISNPDYNSSTVTSSTATASAFSAEMSGVTVTASATTTSKATSKATSEVLATATEATVSTGVVPVNSSYIYPTGSMTVPSSLLTSIATATTAESAGESASASASSSGSAASASTTSALEGAAGTVKVSFASLLGAAGLIAMFI